MHDTPSAVTTPFFSRKNRRTFLHMLAWGFTVIVSGGMLWVLKQFFLFRPRANLVSIGPHAAYPQGCLTRLADHHCIIGHDNKGLYALSDQCTHLGCSVETEGNGLQCPCHHSRFDNRGNPIAGPARRRLDSYYISKGKGNELVIDLAQTVNNEFRYSE